MSIRVEYYRSFEHNLEWNIPMSPRRFSRTAKASKQSPNKKVQQHSLKSKKQRKGLKQAEVDSSTDDTKKRNDRDILDIISSAHDAENVAEEDEEFIEVSDEGVDESGNDRCSDASSLASGPSLPHKPAAKKRKQRPSQGVCSACRKLYQKAKRMKTPIKNKLFDNDPKSLTCDQWVLLKTWRSKWLPSARGNLSTHVKRVQKRLKSRNSAKQTKGFDEVGDPAVCSRQHVFLKRNLTRRVTVLVQNEKKKNRGKRTRDDSQGPRMAKQQRLHSSSSSKQQQVSTGCSDSESLYLGSCPSSSPDFEGCSGQDSDGTDTVVEVIPSKVTLERPTKPQEDPPRQKAAKKGGFRDLLAQMRGNTSVIVRETR